MNRVFDDPAELRQTAERLIDQGRYRLTRHAQREHAELSDPDKIAIVRYGGHDKADAARPAADGVYLCWARHPTHGICRAVYAIERHDDGDVLVLVTAFPE